LAAVEAALEVLAELLATDCHFARLYTSGVFEFAQSVDMVFHTVLTSLESLDPRHEAALSRNPPPLEQTHLLNIGTVEGSHFEEVAAA
jgi:hypothetical protein